ncbi:MAG: toprim domain-containing protein [Caldilineaceae bacterium]
MNAVQAKQIPMAIVLARLGFHPAYASGGNLWYCSPFRQETEPSFKVHVEKNLWYDHGAGQGGNLLDFMMQYHGMDSIAEVLRMLRSQGGPVPAPPTGAVPERRRAASETLVVERVQPLAHRQLLRYLANRAIPAPWARPYLQEIYYSVGERLFYALAFASDSGGYELRNRHFKGSVGAKDITLIRPEGQGDSVSLVVFEGFMDFLSAIVHFNRPRPNAPVLVMNSVAMKDRAVQAIQSLGVSSVRLYLDRDASGRALTHYFQTQLPEIAITDASDLYAGFNDFNAFLMAQCHERHR